MFDLTTAEFARLNELGEAEAWANYSARCHCGICIISPPGGWLLHSSQLGEFLFSIGVFVWGFV